MIEYETVSDCSHMLLSGEALVKMRPGSDFCNLPFFPEIFPRQDQASLMLGPVRDRVRSPVLHAAY